MSGKHYASRSFPDQDRDPYQGAWPASANIDKVFTVIEDIEPEALPDFERRVKQEARRRGIMHVVNLD